MPGRRLDALATRTFKGGNHECRSSPVHDVRDSRSVHPGHPLLRSSRAGRRAADHSFGYGSAAEEQLYVLLAKPDMGKNYGKAYKLEGSRFQSSTQRSQAFEANAIDLASSGAVGVLFAAAEGVTGKVVASLARESPRGFAKSYYVKDDSPIKRVPDAKGKIVGINGFATDGQLWLKTALERHNLT